MDDYRGPIAPRDPVPRKVREGLETARPCREDFADAWPVAVAEALKGVDRRNGGHAGWRQALEATKPRWKSAYELEPAGRDELALSFCREGRDESTEVCVQSVAARCRVATRKDSAQNRVAGSGGGCGKCCGLRPEICHPLGRAGQAHEVSVSPSR